MSVCVFYSYVSPWNEDEATNIMKSSYCDAENPVPVLVVSSPQAVYPTWPTQNEEQKAGTDILFSNVQRQSIRARYKFHTGALDPSQGQLLTVISHFQGDQYTLGYGPVREQPCSEHHSRLWHCWSLQAWP